jgi:dTDP-4-dehydrorhamnose 3,5-epimerase
MRVRPTALAEVLLVEPDVHRDGRGFFLETYHSEKYRAHGITDFFVQDNHSRSAGGTIRGLHLQIRRAQAKLIRVIEGEIFDVAVDVRRGSPTFGTWVGSLLSSENFLECYVPPGFAHGFAVTSSSAQIEYKCSDLYDPHDEIGIAWNDPEIAIRWPVANPTLSERDAKSRSIASLTDRLPLYSRTKL